MSVTDEVRAATQEVAALFRDHYMVPNTWPQVRRFLAAVEALEAPATADGPAAGTQSSSQSGGPGADMIVGGTPSAVPATLTAPADPLPLREDKPERRAPLSPS